MRLVRRSKLSPLSRYRCLSRWYPPQTFDSIRTLPVALESKTFNSLCCPCLYTVPIETPYYRLPVPKVGPTNQ